MHAHTSSHVITRHHTLFVGLWVGLHACTHVITRHELQGPGGHAGRHGNRRGSRHGDRVGGRVSDRTETCAAAFNQLDSTMRSTNEFLGLSANEFLGLAVSYTECAMPQSPAGKLQVRREIMHNKNINAKPFKAEVRDVRCRGAIRRCLGAITRCRGAVR